MFPVRFVYVSPDGADSDREFIIHCHALPRVGDMIVPQSGSKCTVVRVVHTLFTETPEGGPVTHRISVTLKEIAPRPLEDQP